MHISWASISRYWKQLIISPYMISIMLVKMEFTLRIKLCLSKRVSCIRVSCISSLKGLVVALKMHYLLFFFFIVQLITWLQICLHASWIIYGYMIVLINNFIKQNVFEKTPQICCSPTYNAAHYLMRFEPNWKKILQNSGKWIWIPEGM